MSTTTQQRLAVLFGGEEITVKKLDGTDVKVKVALVPVSRMGQFIDLYDKPAELVEFVSHVDGKPVDAGWSDSLAHESVYEIREKAKALNFQNAAKFTDKQIEAGKDVVTPLIEKFVTFQKSVHAHAESLAARATKS